MHHGKDGFSRQDFTRGHFKDDLDGVVPYNYGGIVSMMSYSNLCSPSCLEIPFFSNHLIPFRFKEDVNSGNIKSTFAGFSNTKNNTACFFNQNGDWATKLFEYSDLGSESFQNGDFSHSCSISDQIMSDYNYNCRHTSIKGMVIV